MSFKDYKSLSNMLVSMRKEEYRAEEAGSALGMRKSAVVSWNLERLVGRGDIEDEDSLVQRETLVEKVIDRLMYHVPRAEPVVNKKLPHSCGMRKSAVVSWNLERLVGRGDIEDEDSLVQRETLVEKVIDRLMYHEIHPNKRSEGLKTFKAF